MPALGKPPTEGETFHVRNSRYSGNRDLFVLSIDRRPIRFVIRVSSPTAANATMDFFLYTITDRQIVSVLARNIVSFINSPCYTDRRRTDDDDQTTRCVFFRGNSQNRR